MNGLPTDPARPQPRPQARRSPLAWRLALVLFSAIVAVEAAIFVPSFLEREQELLTEIKSEAVSSISVLLLDRQETTTSALSRHNKFLFERTPIAGYVVYQENGPVVAAAGEAVELRPSRWKYALNQPLRRTEQGTFVDVLWMPVDLQAPFIVAARLSAGHVGPTLQDYTIRIVILSLLIASVATTAILIALNNMVLKPVLALHYAVGGAGRDVSKAHEWVIDDTGVGEIGELTKTVNKILLSVSENFRTVQQNNVGLVEEVQRRLEAEERAGDANKRLLEAIEAFPGGFAIFDADDRLVLSNATYRKFYPASAELIKQGARFADLVREGVMANRRRGNYSRGAYWLRDRTVEHQAGSTDAERHLATGRWVRIRERRTEEGGVVSVWSDISSRKKIESERKEIQSQFFHAQKNDALGTLAGGVAHDFNNLLAIILGNAKLLEMDIAPGAAGREELDAISNAGNRAKNLVKQILTFARQDNGGHEVVDLHDITEEAVSLMSATLPKSIETESKLAASAKIMGDPTQIHQIIMNLCINARDAIGEHSGKILIELEDNPASQKWPADHDTTSDVDSPEQHMKFEHHDYGSVLWMGSPPSGRYFRLSVSDTGAGIDGETFERIFDPFFTTKEVGKGTGLGLAAVQGIIRSHEGALHVETKPGLGTRFEISFPIKDFEAPETAGHDKIEHLSRGQILVLDDEPAIATMLRNSLERKGYFVDSMNDSQAALEAVKQTPDKWDAIISDINMPGLSGTAFAQAVRGIKPNLPVVLCTESLIDSPSNPEATGKDNRPVIRKPVQVEELIETIQRSLSLAPTEEEI